MTIFDIENESKGVWFDVEGGGRVQLRILTGDKFKEIRRKVVKKKVEFKKVEGTPGRFEHEEIDEDLQNELFWDEVIVSWENFFDSKKKPIPCTKENKLLLVSRSAKFTKILTDSLKDLENLEREQAEASEKN